MNFVYAITGYLFIGFLLVGAYTADLERKCGSGDVSLGLVVVGAISWLPASIGYGLNSRGLPPWNEYKCPGADSQKLIGYPR